MTKEELKSFICEMYGIPRCSDLILKQINKYVTERGYEYIDIARALSYFVDVNGGEVKPQFGIKIIEYVMTDAQKYFAELKAQQQRQLEAAQQEQVVKRITYKPRQHSLKRKKIDINKL